MNPVRSQVRRPSRPRSIAPSQGPPFSSDNPLVAFLAFLAEDTKVGERTARQYVAHLQRFAGIAARLEDLAAKELAHECFSPDDGQFVGGLVVEFQGGTCSFSGPPTYSGWYPRLFYRTIYWNEKGFDSTYGSGAKDAIVADVHTDVPCDPCNDPGSVLHEGIGRVNLLLIAVDNGADRFICAGPVLSHYEFEVIGAPRRLSDDEWGGMDGGILGGTFPSDVAPSQLEGLAPPEEQPATLGTTQALASRYGDQIIAELDGSRKIADRRHVRGNIVQGRNATLLSKSRKLGQLDLAGGIVGVIVHIDDVEPGLGDLVRGDVKHRDGMKIPQQQCFLLLGIGSRLVSDLRQRRCWASSLCPNPRDAEKKRQHPLGLIRRHVDLPVFLVSGFQFSRFLACGAERK